MSTGGDIDVVGYTEEISPPPAFFKLDGNVNAPARLRILIYLSLEEGGLQSLLNLRKVSSLTKKWIDTLSEVDGQEVFQKGHVHLDLSESGNLAEFLGTPPAPHVNSLWLEFSHEETFPPEEEEGWSRFVHFWTSTRSLNYLALGSFQISYTDRVLEFLTLTSVRKIRFFWGSFRQFHFGEVYLQLEELWVDFRLDGIGTEDLSHFILGRLKESKQLKVLKVCACEEWAIEDIARIVETKRDKTDFHLTLKLPTYSDALNEGDSAKRFIRSVASSRSKISIECLPDPDTSVSIFTGTVGPDLAKEKLFPCICSVCCYSDRPLLFDLNQFPNLRQIWTSNPGNLPPTVEEIQIEIDDTLPSMQGLSRNLTTVTLWIFLPQLPTEALMRSVVAINEACPVLKKFAIFRTFRWSTEGDEEDEADEGEEETINVQLPDIPFPNMNTFSLSVYCVEEELIRAAVGVRLFLKALLPRLTSLRKLSIVSRQDMLLLDQELLRSLLEGPMRETLCEVDLRDQNVSEDAEELMTSLTSVALENRYRRRDTHGLRRGQIL